MKASRFNVFQQFEDEILAYNSFKDSFLILEPTLHQLFEAAKTEMNFMELKMIHPSFYEALFQNGSLYRKRKMNWQKLCPSDKKLILIMTTSG